MDHKTFFEVMGGTSIGGPSTHWVDGAPITYEAFFQAIKARLMAEQAEELERAADAGDDGREP